MKWYYVIFISLSAFYFAGCSSQRNAVTNDISVLPDKARYMVDNYFKIYHVSYIISDRHGYYVDLYDDITLRFNKKGEWQEIKTRGIDIPTEVMPYTIVSYIHENLPENSIENIKKSSSGSFLVELNNGLKLMFSKTGGFIKVIDED